MNVNPFSYLIEKLKGKVDKSGDTMTGQLRINNNNDTPLTIKKTNASTGKVYIGFENSAEIIGYFSVGADKKPYFASGNGADVQLALTSDYGAKTVVETRHDIVFNNSDTSNWIDPPSAISSKTIYAMVFSSLDGGGGLVTREAGGSNRFAIRWSVAITATLNARLVWFYND